MSSTSRLPAVLDHLRTHRDFMSNVVAWERFPARRARAAPVAHALQPALRHALQVRGLADFYLHQATAIDATLDGENVVVATATASGKTLCYNVPVLSAMLQRPRARALYLFPTKALAHDQEAELAGLLEDGGLPVTVTTYDGDTPRHKRRLARQETQIVITNPDMLHAGILPFHTRWRDLFSALEYVVVDEIHAYRGVFGSHVANVLRRLRRLCRFYGSDPRFICCSATIANPLEHAERLLEAPFTLVDESQNGAPQGAKQFILYNPPLVDEVLGLRQSAILAAKDAAFTFIGEEVQTVVFARARNTVELLLSYLRDELAFYNREPALVAGYRGGYLPLERRSIERGLRDGSLLGVVATNALELGVDIGQLDVAVLTGYPGSVASTWQQAGRAGRRNAESAALLIASGNPLDQYICTHPRYLFGRSPEHALINPDNLRLLVKHLLCATYELPFQPDEPFGGFGPAEELLTLLEEEGTLHRTRVGRREQFHWLGEEAPAHTFSLRTSGDDTVVIQSMEESEPQVIGEVDLESAPHMVFEGAIYSHLGRTFLVDRLDWEGRLAQVRPVEVDYYTRASIGSQIRELTPEEQAADHDGQLLRAIGDVLVVTRATAYRKVKRYTHETLGYGEIDLPEMELFTTGYWLVFGDALTAELLAEGILQAPNEYGPNWTAQRRVALERDGQRCTQCGAAARPGQGLHVHHIRPFRDFGYVPGENDRYRQANRLDNLITLCPNCHQRAEAQVQTRSALSGLAYVLRNLAPLFLMCDPGDIQVTAETRSPLTNAPTVVIYEQVPAGVGFSRRLFELHEELLAAALELVTDCRCRDGCPACVGPPGEIGPETKAVTRLLLQRLQPRGLGTGDGGLGTGD